MLIAAHAHLDEFLDHGCVVTHDGTVALFRHCQTTLPAKYSSAVGLQHEIRVIGANEGAMSVLRRAHASGIAVWHRAVRLSGAAAMSATARTEMHR
jgi:hypothetical protein